MSTTSTTTTPRAEMAFVVAGRIVIRSSTNTAQQQQQSRALPFGHLASQAAGLPVELLASERDLVARSEALIADDLMTWEPLDDGADFVPPQH